MIMDGARPDIFLLDIMMPGLNGCEVCQKVRETHSAASLPIIMFTAKNRLSDLVEGLKAGANDYLPKPFFKDELLARVKTQLKIKQAYETLKENMNLKKEIKRRKQTELDLRMMQLRLTKIMDTIDDAIIAVNANHEICFSNQRCEHLLGYDTKHLLGQPVLDLFPTGAREDTKNHMDEADQDILADNFQDNKKVAVLQGNTGPVSCRLLFTTLDIAHEHLLVMIVQPPEIESDKSAMDSSSALLFIEELNQSRKRIQSIENLMELSEFAEPGQNLRQGLNLLANTLEQMEASLTGITDDAQKKRLGVKVMTLALEYWQKSTGLTKVDLAEQSGIWKVYVTHNGFERTQTLDKYLDIRQVPKKPRWKKILHTIDFVLLACDKPMPERECLEISFLKFKFLK